MAWQEIDEVEKTVHAACGLDILDQVIPTAENFQKSDVILRRAKGPPKDLTTLESTAADEKIAHTACALDISRPRHEKFLSSYGPSRRLCRRSG